MLMLSHGLRSEYTALAEWLWRNSEPSCQAHNIIQRSYACIPCK